MLAECSITMSITSELPGNEDCSYLCANMLDAGRIEQLAGTWARSMRHSLHGGKVNEWKPWKTGRGSLTSSPESGVSLNSWKLTT
mmetsp:Transcript_91440/g.200389  ORF Transcript_91440/g.200389 Transcript_91440/m.200389 type:complete len:85 (-) Transcript_91440:737-991(-)